MNKNTIEFLRLILPHLSTALSLMLIVLVYVHLRNPFMGFLTSSTAIKALLIIAAVNIISSWTSILARRRSRHSRDN